MPRFLSRLLAVLAIATFSFAAQDPNEVNRLTRDVLSALTAKKYDEALSKLGQILELQPEDRGTAYNFACVHSLKGDADKAIEWAGKAVDWGWGPGWGSIAGQEAKELTEVEMLEQDADLANARKDERFKAVLERASALRKSVDEFRGSAAVYIPEKVKALAEMPLLVVLHDDGSSKEAVVAGKWKAIADELGMALVAPSGRHLAPRSKKPADGMLWIANAQVYQQKPWIDERPIQDALSAFSKEHKLDKARVLIAGEGTGGSVAADAAVASPYQYKAALAFNGLPIMSVVSSKASNAAKAGLRLEFVLDANQALDMLGSAEQLEATLKTINESLTKWSIGGGARSVALDAKDADAARKVIVERLKALLEAPRATEAASAPAEKK